MNVDQIVDKKTVAIPGPMGPAGPQGLPGPGATPADEAVAAYINDADSSTSKSLETILLARNSGRVNVFPTVDAMAASSDILEGQVLATTGFHQVNDGGAALYFATHGQPNGMDIISISNGLVAQIVNGASIDPKQLGARADGSTDDTEPIKRAAYICQKITLSRGTYLVSSHINLQNKTVIGDNMAWTSILSNNGSGDGVCVTAGLNTCISNLCIGFTETVISNGSPSVALRLRSDEGGALNHATLSDLYITNAATGISDGGSLVFSCTFNNIHIHDMTSYGWRFTSSGRTGNVYQNIYVSNIGFVVKNNEDSHHLIAGFALEGSESECTISQLNVEHMTCDHAAYFNGIEAVHINSLHFEGIRNINNYEDILYITSTSGYIGSVSFYYTRCAGTCTLIMFGSPVSAATTQGYNGITIDTINCVGLNQPDRNTYGYDPAYPVSQAGITNSTVYFLASYGDTITQKYYVTVNHYNFKSPTNPTNDTALYKVMATNPRKSLVIVKKGDV